MRINTIGTPVVTIPEQTLEVGASRAVRQVVARNPGEGETGQRSQGRAVVPAGQPAVPAVPGERRAQSRRGEERRKRQLPVLIDTRVGERRAQRRRAQDDAPPSIDVEA